MIPATPGGLGLVEASLTAGPIAYGLFWLRYKRHRTSPQTTVAGPAVPPESS
jgi:hypothetical protein